MPEPLDESSFSRAIVSPDDLSEEDIRAARGLWDQAIVMIPRSIRPSSAKLDEDEFNSFLNFVFAAWNIVDKPKNATQKRKTAHMTSLPVGKWFYDVPRSKQDQKQGETAEKKPVPAWKQKGGDAHCRPEIISGTIVFKIIDSHSTMHNFEDVRWSYRGGLTTELKIRICAHFDTNEISHVREHNLRAARSLTQAYIRRTYILDQSSVEEMNPVPVFIPMNLRLPLWKIISREAKNGRRLAKKELAKMKKSYKF
ncbi:hypothetical protein PFICI_11637 [Pestalotiopsis fici W106-1]|uniref:Uncharacterized protein n=1 Tax=Pestalotiopsis fici (strain W106-1 / CGMCC3.15140) TaxID=1229662 RepID=W3WQW6_PESFW|nr:uncharacterized protein PFICI_11637 [Pestalotiopsis fici W106-1]ETS76250.1 hypothetical protein PFICI_11637 [Pestalotiopsis fici W106-1]